MTNAYFYRNSTHAKLYYYMVDILRQLAADVSISSKVKATPAAVDGHDDVIIFLSIINHIQILVLQIVLQFAIVFGTTRLMLGFSLMIRKSK